MPAALEENFRLWPLDDVAFEPIFAPYSLYPVESHAEEVLLLRTWLHERLLWVDARIDSYPD